MISFVTLLFAAGTTDIYNQSATYKYDIGYVKYNGTVTFTDSAANYHTKPIKIGNANLVDGMITTNITTGYTAASDIQVKFHFSNDLTNWFTQTLDAGMDLDAVQNKADTLGVYNGTDGLYFHGFNWMIIEFDGQTANPTSSVITWAVRLKPNITTTHNGAAVSSGAVASRANSVP